MESRVMSPNRSSSRLRTLLVPNFIRRFLAKISSYKGIMSESERFLVLDDKFLSKFDEIVVIGDVHGCYDEFKELLHKLHEETPTKVPSKCLKIIVGDLVNKGPKSKKVLEACRDTYQDSILSVRGNHDEIVLSLYNEYRQTRKPLPEKNRWIESLPSRYVEYLKILPYTIKIPSLKVMIVHGGLDPSKEDPATNTPINLMTTMRNIVVGKDPKTKEPYYICTKSYKEGIAWATFWPGPEHVYFGHDARRRLQEEHEFATGLDTGCVYGDRLSYAYIKGSKKGQIFSIKAKKAYEPVSDTETKGDEKKMKSNEKEN